MKKFLSAILSLTLAVTAVCPALTVKAATYAERLKNSGFPDSYIESLVKLHAEYPNWEFKPFVTGLSFASAVSGERSSHRKQILEKGYNNKYYCSCSKCKKNGSFVYQYSGCYSASEFAVEYYMDPRNWLDEKHIFQFESNKYNSAHTQSGVEAIIKNTWMKNANITYLDTSGNSVTLKSASGNKIKYSQAVMESAKAHNISAYYIASRIVKEVGSANPTASGTAGNKSPFLGMYNYYSIGATSGGMSGLEWASGFLLASSDTKLYSSYNSNTKKAGGTVTSIKSGQRMSFIANCGDYYKVKLYSDSGSYSTNGAVGYVPVSKLRTTYFTYSRPWTNPYKTIYGGAWYISNKYLAYQYTTYLEKFNVNKSSGTLYDHEYMQNVDAPSTESVSKYNAYKNAGQLKNSKTFYIPVFYNMPSDTSTAVATTSSKVSGLKVSGTSVNSITLKWNKVSGATKYRLKVKNLTKGNTFSKTVTTHSAKLRGLTKGHLYQIRVRAYTGGSWGKYSAAVKARCKPSKAKVKSVSAAGRGKIKTVWKKTKGAAGYQIVYAHDSAFKDVAARKLVKKTAFTGKGFTKGHTYYVKVRAYIKFRGKKYYGKFSKVKAVTVK